MGSFKIIEKMDKLYKNKHYFKERELAILEFNARVLDLAKDEEIPIMERLNFIKIVFSNLDEFISIKLPECNDREKYRYINYMEKLYQIMDELIVDNLQNSSLSISAVKTPPEPKTKFFIDGGIYYVYLDKSEKFNIVPMLTTKEDVEEKVKILENMKEIKTSFLIRFISDKTFTYIYTGENTQEILNEIKCLIKIKENCSFNYIQSTCDDEEVLKKFLESTQLEFDDVIYTGELVIQIDRIMKRLKPVNTDPLLYFPEFKSEYKKIDYISKLLEKDILIYNPYESYTHVIDFIHQMCMSPDINTIFSSLYRTSEHSIIVDSLIKAKQMGKEVYVYVELTARGNEDRNVRLIEKLLANGIFVSCNYYNYKVHAKLFCAVSNDGVVYAHVGTGNYNEDTAKLYTDLQLLTANPQVSRNALDVFKCLFKKKIYFPDPTNRTLLYTSPINLREEILRCIDKEISKKENGLIYIKCNSLCDFQVIDKLYEASKAGVQIKIMVRSANSILPTENIEIRSKVGRFLEHDRIYIFGTDVYISSADLLLRNINKRVEILCKISDNDIKVKIINIFSNAWNADYVQYIGKDFRWKYI